MNRSLVSVYDTVAKVYGPPLAFLNSGEAVRWFSDMVNDRQENNVSKHPKDFVLYEIGLYEDSTSVIVSHKVPTRLGLGSDFKEKLELVK